MRRLNSIAFLIVHVLGTLLAFTTLLEAWKSQLLLNLLIGRSLIFRLLGIPPAASSLAFWGILIGTTLTTLAALWAR
jgi:hypothetical protein